MTNTNKPTYKQLQAALKRADGNISRILAEHRRNGGGVSALSYIHIGVRETENEITVTAVNLRYGGERGYTCAIGWLADGRRVVYKRADVGVVTGELALQPVFSLFGHADGRCNGHRQQFWPFEREDEEGAQ